MSLLFILPFFMAVHNFSCFPTFSRFLNCNLLLFFLFLYHHLFPLPLLFHSLSFPFFPFPSSFFKIFFISLSSLFPYSAPFLHFCFLPFPLYLCLFLSFFIIFFIKSLVSLFFCSVFFFSYPSQFSLFSSFSFISFHFPSRLSTRLLHHHLSTSSLFRYRLSLSLFPSFFFLFFALSYSFHLPSFIMLNFHSPLNSF
ncbi:unnamed protein product [Acanthosepion pharaonis]|uniref:Uncharacterized protein n=1 Tax=Acanthosepion pharaonis TaxID=158019 RepID=A0A812D8E5_ACAPH|nr:unnamed protein product [Sepia pharaonis]